ncbi:Prolyl-tRNA synthetase, bacterial type [Candidatus Nasuia deltocephalinicola]|nr:Prolyl-tRNA synthetase, bacterial type [Candidatus Nasuia deltocephalinicola]
MFILNNKFFKIKNFSNYFIGYLDCLNFCNIEFFNILNSKNVFKNFFYKFENYFITLNFKKDFFLRKKFYFSNMNILRIINTNFIPIYKKKLNIFFKKIFNFNKSKYIIDHNILNFFFYKKNKIKYYSHYFFLYIYKYIIINYNLLYNYQKYFNYINFFYNLLLINILYFF